MLHIENGVEINKFFIYSPINSFIF